ncbi:MAG TPA: hypothetical protein VMM58_00055, partial [Bacteroidota bacterium]|nr:hypothetical protein [Bacteroidota bacterium]
QHPGDMPSNSLLDNPKLSAVTLAKVGPWNVTAQEFLLNYEYGPAFPKREPDSKRRYLTYMIYEKLLALDGYSRGLQSSRMVKEVLDEVKADLATEELYKDDVLDSIHIPEKQIERGVSGENIHLSLRWLYSRSKDEMSRRSALMRDGVSFDSLFALQCPDSASADDRSMETTRFKLEMKNPQFVSAIDTLHVGTVSPPIQGPDGWYVVKIVNAWTNPILTESENQKLHEDVRRALLQHESDSLSDAYVHRMLLRQEPVIDKEAFGFLEAWLGRKFLSPEQYASWGMKEKPAERSRTPDPDSVGQYRNQVLVRMKNGRFLFEDFLSWFKPREPYVRLDTKSLHGYAESVEELIWRMARDRMLTKEAYRRGLQKRKNVAQQVKWWEEKLVYRAVKLEIENGIKQSDSTLHSYYEEHQRDYRNDKGIVRSFEEVKEDVSRDEFAYETTSRLLHQILRLKQKYGVKINDDTLKKLYVDIENSPKAIDVYTVKKGGIFPHTAFPSIDYEWQAWD